MTKTIEIYGGVILGDGHEYLDDEIATLVDCDVSDWDFSGSQSPEESNIYVNIIPADGKSERIFDGDNALPQALAYIKTLQA